MDDRIFTIILDWLAFTVPQATVDEIGELLGGEWLPARFHDDRARWRVSEDRS